MRIKPNDRCLVVGESPGCEGNIGATLTVTTWEIVNGVREWEFKDESRPLRMRDSRTGKLEWTSDINRAEYAMWIYDRFLVPLENPPETLIFSPAELFIA